MRLLVKVYDGDNKRTHSVVVEAESAREALSFACLKKKSEWRTASGTESGFMIMGNEEANPYFPLFAVQGTSYKVTEARDHDLDPRELAAVLAGLRALQDLRTMTAGELPDDINVIYTNAESHEGLTDDEIDQLCERLNVQ